MARFIVLIAFVCAGQAAAAAECGSRMALAQVDGVTGELQKGVFALAAYGESLPSRAQANAVDLLVQELIILHERLGRVVLLVEIRDAMRHAGEKSFVQYKLSHEASLLKLVSSRARHGLDEFVAERPAIGEGPLRLRDAIARAEALFAMCDSPM